MHGPSKGDDSAVARPMPDCSCFVTTMFRPGDCDPVSTRRVAPEPQVVDPDQREQRAHDVHRPGHDAGGDDERLYDGPGNAPPGPTQQPAATISRTASPSR